MPGGARAATPMITGAFRPKGWSARRVLVRPVFSGWSGWEVLSDGDFLVSEAGDGLACLNGLKRLQRRTN